MVVFLNHRMLKVNP